MEFLDFIGLKSYHEKLVNWVNSKVGFTKNASDAASETTNNVIYFTPDTHEIYVNGEKYGGTDDAEENPCTLTAEAVDELPSDDPLVGMQKMHNEETFFYPVTHTDAIIGYEEDQKAISGALNYLNSQITWQDE